MKRFLSLLLVAALITVFALGCSTPAQRTAYNTIATVQQTAAVAYDGYADLVIAGTVSTTALPEVSLRYNQLRLACTVAATASQAGTNAIAPATLTAELVQFTALVATFVPAK